MRPLRLPAWGLALLLTAGWLAMVVQPIHARITCVATLALAALAWVAWLRVPKARKPALVLGQVIILAGMLMMWLPGNPASNRDALAARFVLRLDQTAGWRYQRAGENRLGVDCSGLVRHAWRIALWQEAWNQRHAGWAREAVHNWWFDAGARAMGEEYQGRTRKVMDAPSLDAARTGPLQPGDLAVTLQENHLLAHLGEGRWIQADPSARRVTILDPGQVERAWANIPMRIVRWRELSEAWFRRTREAGVK